MSSGLSQSVKYILLILFLTIAYSCLIKPEENTLPLIKTEIPVNLKGDIIAEHFIVKSTERINKLSNDFEKLFRQYYKLKGELEKLPSGKNKSKLSAIMSKLEVNYTFLSLAMLQIENEKKFTSVGLALDKINALDSVYELLKTRAKLIEEKYTVN